MTTTTQSSAKAAPVVVPLEVNLRDYFAAHALAGIMAQSHTGPKEWTDMGHGWGEDCVNHLNKHEAFVAHSIAQFAYQIAEAMLTERARLSAPTGEK